MTIAGGLKCFVNLIAQQCPLEAKFGIYMVSPFKMLPCLFCVFSLVYYCACFMLTVKFVKTFKHPFLLIKSCVREENADRSLTTELLLATTIKYLNGPFERSKTFFQVILISCKTSFKLAIF